MVYDGKLRFLPLSFNDGKCEYNIGQVGIHSSLNYKTFQIILSQKIGISPNQMSIYFVDRNNNNPKLLHQRRILITGEASFNLILQGRDCTVLAVLKRSKKDRGQKSKLENVADSSYYFNENNLAPGVPVNLFSYPVVPSYYDQTGLFLYNYPIIEEPKYFVPERCNYNSYCKECNHATSQGKAVQFHLCVNDAIAAPFRSPAAGPIARPTV